MSSYPDRWDEHHEFVLGTTAPDACVCGLYRSHMRHTPTSEDEINAAERRRNERAKEWITSITDITPPVPAKTLNSAPGSAHYQALSPQPIEVIRAWDLGHLRSTALKYLARAGLKGGAAGRVMDLEKCIQYAQWELEDAKAALELTQKEESQSDNE